MRRDPLRRDGAETVPRLHRGRTELTAGQVELLIAEGHADEKSAYDVAAEFVGYGAKPWLRLMLRLMLCSEMARRWRGDGDLASGDLAFAMRV